MYTTSQKKVHLRAQRGVCAKITTNGICPWRTNGEAQESHKCKTKSISKQKKIRRNAFNSDVQIKKPIMNFQHYSNIQDYMNKYRESSLANVQASQDLSISSKQKINSIHNLNCIDKSLLSARRSSSGNNLEDKSRRLNYNDKSFKKISNYYKSKSVYNHGRETINSACSGKNVKYDDRFCRDVVPVQSQKSSKWTSGLLHAKGKSIFLMNSRREHLELVVNRSMIKDLPY